MSVALRQGICSSVVQIGAMLLGILTPALKVISEFKLFSFSFEVKF